MSDLALLGMRFETQGDQETNRALDQYADKADQAERATDSLASSRRQLTSASSEMMSSIVKSVQAIEQLMRAQQSAASSAAAVATQQTRATAAVAAGSAVNVRYAMSFTAVQTQAAAATAATERLTTATTQAASAARRAGADFATMYDADQLNFATQYARQMGVVTTAQGRATQSSKGLSLAALDLSRQFADVGVTAAMGMNPLMILLQQGPQIADRLALMKMEGIGLGAAFRGMTAGAAPFLIAIAPLIALAGAAAAGFALMNRELSKGYPKDITDGLGLTAEQLERVETRTVTMGDTFMATLDVMGGYLTAGPLGEGLKWLADAWNSTLDFMTTVAFKGTAIIVGGFVGAYRTIVNNWRSFPAVFADIVAAGFNAALEQVQKFVNANIYSLNSIKSALSTFNPSLKLIPDIEEVDLSRFKMKFSGAAEFAGKALASNIGAAIADAEGGLRKIGGDIGARALARAQAKAIEEAGKANKTAKGPGSPRDKTDERNAQLEGMLASALAEELQARLALTQDVKARAALEKQILAAQEAVKSAQLDRQAASIADDKGLSDATKTLLLMQLEAVRLTQDRTAALREQGIDEVARKAVIKQESEVRIAGLSLEVEMMSAQRDTARFAYQRRDADAAILKAQEEIERLKLQEVIDTTESGAAEHKIAVARMAVLATLYANFAESQRQRDLASATDGATRAIQDIGAAIRDHDWGKVFTSLIDAIDQAKVAFASAKTFAERASAGGSLLSAAGGAIGGRAGSVLGAAGAGFSAAGAAAGMAGTMGSFGTAIAGLAGPIGIAVAGFTLLNGLLGSDKAKKRAKAEQEARDIENARAIAQERANQAAALNLRALELSGDELAVTTYRRNAEIAALDVANQALARHVHALEDWAKAVGAAKDAVSKAEDDLREAYNAERERLEGVIGLVEVARDRLRAAYQIERAAIESTIASVRSLVESLTGFRNELDLNPIAANNPMQQYAATKAQFDSAAPADLPKTGSAFAEASLGASSTRVEFERDMAAVRRRTEEAAKIAGHQLTEAEKQLVRLDAQVAGLLAVNDNVMSVDQAIQGLLTAEAEAALAAQQITALDAQVGALITINTSVLSVVQAITNLQSALSALAAAEASKPAGGGGTAAEIVGLAGYVDKNADLAALFASGTGMARGRSKEEFGAYHWERYGQAENRIYRPFAAGGVFTNGIVSEPTAFNMGQMGEAGPEAIMPLVRGPEGLGVRSAGNDNAAGEIRALRAEVAQMRSEQISALRAIALSNHEMVRQGKDIQVNGVFSRGADPDSPVETTVAA